MKISRNRLAIASFLLLGNVGLARAGGFSAWQQVTPGRNLIDYDGRGRHSMICQQGAYSAFGPLEKWYFYRGYVLGKTFEAANGDMLQPPIWFAFEESTCTLHEFQHEAAFEAFLRQHRLQPRIRTRWYNGDWTFFTSEQFSTGILLTYLVIFPVLPFAVGYFITFGVVAYRHRFSWKVPLTRNFVLITIAVPLLLALMYWLETHPQSW